MNVDEFSILMVLHFKPVLSLSLLSIIEYYFLFLAIKNLIGILLEFYHLIQFKNFLLLS